MQRLILLRHGKAESTSASGGDAERRLTDRGHRESALIGRMLAEADFVPDCALVSTARRTRETWDEAARAFPSARAEDNQRLYLASRDEIGQVLARVSDKVHSLMVVGHNPGLHEFALSCLDRKSPGHKDAERMLASFPTAAAAVFSADPKGGWRLERVLTPRDFDGRAA